MNERRESPESGRARAPLSPSARIWMLTVSIAGAGLLIAQFRSSGWLEQHRPFDVDWWMLAPAFAASEIFVIHYQFRREQYSFTLMELPLAVGLFFTSWPQLIIARLVGGGLALRFHRKQGVMKMAFNLACNVFETSLAVVLFRLAAGQAQSPTIRPVSAAVGAIWISAFLVTCFIALAISVFEGRPDRRSLVRLFIANQIVAITNVSLAMVAVSVLWVNRATGWLLLVVVGILLLGYRSYASLQQKHDDLELLYDFTRRAGRALDADAGTRELLSQVGTVLRARVVELLIDSHHETGSLVRMRLVEGSDVHMSLVSPDALWERTVRSERPLLAAAPIADAELAADLAEHDVRDALVAALCDSNEEVIGMMLAGDRLGELRTFTKDDLKLFEALANHASVSLENRHLIERLRAEAAEKEHQALHDALTGLPNRLLFQLRVGGALARARERRSSVAVMLLDLDRFKEVNDTLGHHNGDLLLQEISERLRRILRAGDTVARLGGDEFAVLLPDLAGDEAALAAADGIRHALERPFEIAGVNLDVGCSIGIAMWPQHGEDPTILLQRSDVAMYSAKENRRGVDIYDANRDTYSLERLSLVGELRQAIELGELAVHYQPKADIVSGQLLGVEALVRWEHPRHGAVPPEEIIAIAEQTGLIRPLTLWVLHQALRQCSVWRRAGRNLDMAVNLSIRNLLDAELPADVLRLLADFGLPASALTFEITESSIMNDPGRSVSVLARLKAMGVQLAIDDFGTGYSSFSHLQRLPVDEIKIDKSFVQHMATDESDLVIVRSIVDLGRNLGLRVCAEGVENEAVLAKLATLGCDVAQGFVMSPPVPAAEFEAWVDQRKARPIEPQGDVVPLRSPASRRS